MAADRGVSPARIAVFLCFLCAAWPTTLDLLLDTLVIRSSTMPMSLTLTRKALPVVAACAPASPVAARAGEKLRVIYDPAAKK
jgi:hypothetical protein